MGHLTSQDYISCGSATLSRQVICAAIAAAPLKGHPIYVAAVTVLKFAAHEFNLRMKILEEAMSASLLLVEQSGYPLLLQTSEEMDKLMAAQIPIEERQIALASTIRPFLVVTNPLAWLSLGNYIDSFNAQVAAHKAVLMHFEQLWEWKLATVTEVVDGDTFKVDVYDEHIRFEDIDCPELDTEAGKAAKAYTESRLLGKEVELRARKYLDEYNRRIAKVYLDGKNFAYELVQQGLAKFVFLKPK